MSDTVAQGPPDPITEAARKGRARKSFFSFGDNGLTASVGITGRLLRITQHFPGQKTGICVDDKNIHTPFFVYSRLQGFLNNALDESQGGIGPRINSLYSEGDSLHGIVNDRWPNFTGTIPGDASNKLRVSYVAFQGTIYQTFEIIDTNEAQSSRSLTKEFPSNILHALSLDPELFIRNLDFVTWENEFNEDDSQSLDDFKVLVYTTTHGKAKNHVSREHKRGDKNFVLHLQVLDQSNSLEFRKSDQAETCYGIRKSSDDLERAVSKVVLAYTLKQGSSASESELLLPNWRTFLEADKLLRHQTVSKLTNDDTFDFFLKRNLEHILSVCSIPVSKPDSDGIPAMALTCGDADGHRVATPASFYAFQLLLLGLDHFTALQRDMEVEAAIHPTDCTSNRGKEPLPSPTLPYVCMMKRRIEFVCKGHMKWVFRHAAKSDSFFCPNYWTNGEEIKDWEFNHWLPQKSLTDTPFQLIKAADFYKRLQGGMPEELRDKAKAVYKKWICHLGEVEKSGQYAFPSYKASDVEERTKTFYLTDHALIWQAIRSAESTDLRIVAEGDPKKTSRYSSEILRENIVRRFTTENTLLKQRMIAVKRSPNQSRFLFRSKDVALFRAVEECLFEKTDVQWTNTLDCQKHHEGNDDVDWSDPRRFALAIIVAQQGRPINFRTEEEMIQRAVSVLLSSSSSNGLFTGALDQRQGPVTYEDERDRDNYWTVVFEVPYILWKDYCFKPRKIIDYGAKGASMKIDSRLELMHMSIKGISKHLEDLTVHPTETTGPRYRYGYWMKHNIPFNNVIDDNNVVELQDEWLYNEPDFFVNTTAMVNVDTENGSDANTNTEASPSAKVILAYVQLKIDIQERRPLKEKRPPSSFRVEYYPQGQEGSFEEVIKSQRTAQDAKKRFWAFISTNAEGNSSCTKTLSPTEEREQREMEQFFDRHKTSSNFFNEETIAALNIWTTEFQISFYSGVEEGGFWCGSEIEKAAMGFRFEGDFFDKYWTCRFVVANPHLPASEHEVKIDLIRLLQQDHEDDTHYTWEVKIGPWEQRRVLELILFGHIIKEMAMSAGHILKLARKTVEDQKKRLEKRLVRLQRLQGSQPFKQEEHDSTPDDDDDSKQEQHGPTPDDDGPIDYNSFVITSNEFRKFQEHLQMIHGDFTKARPISDHWFNREKDRQAEQPRWTFSDESRYRSTLNKLLVTNRRTMQDLDRNLKGISILADSITKELEYVSGGLQSISNEESRQNNNDVKLFTYTTAVFLPLGFATGVFSMSGPPDGPTVGYMFAVFIGLFIVVASIFLYLTKKYKELVRLVRLVRLSGWKPRENGIASSCPRHEGSPEGKSIRRKNTDSTENVADKFSWRGGLSFFRSNEKEAGGALEAGRVRRDASMVDGTAPSGSA